MDVLQIDLSEYSDRFSVQGMHLNKNVNFIFGRNGTGKSTITKQIKTQFEDHYDVRIFQDFEGITGENKRLDAIALGKENTEIQGKLDNLDVEIRKITSEISQPKIGETVENLYTTKQKTQKDLSDQNTKIKNFYTKTASTIRGMQNPSIASPNYKSPNLQREISKGKILSEEELKKNREIIKSERKPKISSINFPNLYLESYLKATNEILDKKVSQPQSIPELIDEPKNQSFVKEGMQLHKHEVGEKCIFCGNEISEIRWEQLSGFFNDEVAQLNKRIEKGVETTREGLEYIETLQQLDPIDFYSEFRERVLEINLKISKTQAECREFLLTLQSAIKDKYNSLFISCDALSLTIPDGFFEIEKRVEALINDSNNYSEQLDIKQSNATDNLRYHEIKVALDEFNYSIECEKYSGLKSEFDIASENLVRRYQELEDKRQERSNLILETRDERKIADKINVALRKMGVSSFSLELIEDDEGQKGQYKIRGYGDLNGGQGQLRTIHELSKGEKNIIAFLYFIFSIEATPTSNPKIIVLDDPMTSNDDSLQYLMIAEIKELFESFKETNNCAILLTHNVHFYLNTQLRYPLTSTYNYSKHIGHFHFLTSNNRTVIKTVNTANEDFKTNYEMIWKELRFLYDHSQADLMLGCCRRICENYKEFTCKKEFYEGNDAAKKLFDVNQHSMYDMEAEPNGKTKEEIIDVLENLFLQNDAKDHFDTYWGVEEQNS